MMAMLVVLLIVAQAGTPSGTKGVRLDRITWTEAQAVLGPETVVVVPLGAAAAEHGPHLRLNTDLALAEYLTQRVIDASTVVVAPAIPYHYYPPFVQYPGSTSLTLATARELTMEVVRSLARFGPRRFYVINAGVSTMDALQPAAAALANDGILLRYTDLAARLTHASRSVRRQERGSHADEIETSMMLYIDRAAVDMSKASRESGPEVHPFRLTRSPDGRGTYSPTGTWGDPTLATAEKGRVIVDALVAAVLEEIEALRGAAVPVPSSRDAPRSTAPPVIPSVPGASSRAGCTPGDERTIRKIADSFYVAWTYHDYERLGALWTTDGDIVHPDGWVERGVRVITENRRELFTRREYRHSRHPLTLGHVRCVSADVAVADGKWELRGVTDSAGGAVPPMEGLVTLVVTRHEAGWRIDAYRYTIKPAAGASPPTLLKRPGFPGAQ